MNAFYQYFEVKSRSMFIVYDSREMKKNIIRSKIFKAVRDLPWIPLHSYVTILIRFCLFVFIVFGILPPVDSNCTLYILLNFVMKNFKANLFFFIYQTRLSCLISTFKVKHFFWNISTREKYRYLKVYVDTCYYTYLKKILLVITLFFRHFSRFIRKKKKKL